MKLILLLLLLPAAVFSQSKREIKAECRREMAIVVDSVAFIDACNYLLDKNLKLQNKDA